MGGRVPDGRQFVVAAGAEYLGYCLSLVVSFSRALRELGPAGATPFRLFCG
jgi:hypothetical protein